jgi:hypothetical protein
VNLLEVLTMFCLLADKLLLGLQLEHSTGFAQQPQPGSRRETSITTNRSFFERFELFTSMYMLA